MNRNKVDTINGDDDKSSPIFTDKNKTNENLIKLDTLNNNK